MTEFFDSLERRSPDERNEAYGAALPRLIAAAVKKAPAWAAHLADVDPEAVTSREALADLPVLRKSALSSLQADTPPFGGFATEEPGAFGRLLTSPGPIFEPEAREADYWRTARAFFAAGFRKGDIVHNTFAYHLSPGAFIMEGGALALGCAVIPAGVGNTEMQVIAISHYRPSGFAGTPDYLKTLLEAGESVGKDMSSIRRMLVSGGALFPSLRAEYEGRGINCLQCYATGEVGLIAYESQAQEGMIIDEGVIVEVVAPGTGSPVPDGDVGEVVVTVLNEHYPLIRLATGDLSAVLAGPSPCGRTNMRIKGWMGRADQAAKVKGMFVRPEQVAEISRRHPELGRLRLEVSREDDRDVMTLRAECGRAEAALAEKVSETLRSVTKIKGQVLLEDRGSLPNDGLVIADLREYE